MMGGGDRGAWGSGFAAVLLRRLHCEELFAALLGGLACALIYAMALLAWSLGLGLGLGLDSDGVLLAPMEVYLPGHDPLDGGVYEGQYGVLVSS